MQRCTEDFLATKNFLKECKEKISELQDYLVRANVEDPEEDIDFLNGDLKESIEEIISDFNVVIQDNADDKAIRKFYYCALEDCVLLIEGEICENEKNDSEILTKKEALDKHLIRLIKEILKERKSIPEEIREPLIKICMKYNAYELFVNVIDKCKLYSETLHYIALQHISNTQNEKNLIADFLIYNNSTFFSKSNKIVSLLEVLVEKYQDTNVTPPVSKTYPFLTADERNKILNWLLCMHVDEKRKPKTFKQPKPIKFLILNQVFKNNDALAKQVMEEAMLQPKNN